MPRSPAFLFFVLMASSVAVAAPPNDELVQKLKAAIRRYSSEAQFEITEGEFIAKAGTMNFTVHNRSKSGEVFPTTHQEEGPNFKGFLLRVSLQPGRYEGAAVVPQTLVGPYYPSDIDAVPTANGNQYYWVNFSYGSRLDPALKKAITESIPKTRFAPQTAPAPEPQ